LRILFLLNCVALFACGFLTAQTSTSPQKKATKKKTIRHRGSSSTTSAAHSSHKSTAAASNKPHRAAAKKSKPAVARRSVQSQPTPERYKEIQEALASRGYFKGTPDGNWGPESVDALKRFQRDQNLTDDGKIGSLSLIALGLGPKRAAAAEPASENKVQQ
jgi:peptidoglycan hydrolase-like protein with peptidoglycan-binding domain